VGENGKRLRWDAIPDVTGAVGDVEPEVIMWLDPSNPSGWATWRPRTESFSSGELSFNHLGALISGISDVPEDVWLGWEAYTIRPGSGRIKQDGISLQVIGMARWLAYDQGMRQLKPQQPSDRTLGLKHLKAVGWHNPGKEDADDAAAHLLAFLLNHKVLPQSFLEKVLAQLGGDG
jgi:hypothetical protein